MGLVSNHSKQGKLIFLRIMKIVFFWFFNFRIKLFQRHFDVSIYPIHTGWSKLSINQKAENLFFWLINNNQYHLNITLPTQSHWVARKAFLIHISLLIMARFIEIKILISKTSLPSSKSMQIQAKFSGPGFVHCNQCQCTSSQITKETFIIKIINIYTIC